MKDPRAQLMAVITATRNGDDLNAGQLLHEMSKHDLQRALAVLVSSHINQTGLIAQHLGTTVDEMYKQMAIEATRD